MRNKPERATEDPHALVPPGHPPPRPSIADRIRARPRRTLDGATTWQRVAGMMDSADTTGLSPEATRVLQFVAEGLGAGAIAARLGCDTDGLCRHLASAVATLGARSMPDAVDIAIRRGLIEAPR